MGIEPPTCAICQLPIDGGSNAVVSRKGKITNYGDGPIFSVTGHRGVFHKRCFEEVMAPHVRPAGDEHIDTWIDSHIPVSERVVSAAINFETPGELARAVQDGSIMRESNVGEQTAAEIAELLLRDDLLRDPPGYLPANLFEQEY